VNEQCLRLQPQADILEAHGNAKRKLKHAPGEFFVTAACRGAGSIPRSKAGLSVSSVSRK
jgi:hypothetical protein